MINLYNIYGGYGGARVGDVPPVRGPTDKTLLTLPLADYQSDSDSDADAVAVAATATTILRIVHKKSNTDNGDSNTTATVGDESGGVDALKSRLLRFSMLKSSVDKESLSHSQPAEEAEAEGDSGEVEEGEEVEEDDAVVMEEDEESASAREIENDKDDNDEEEDDDDDDDDDDDEGNEEEVIELDSESAGLFAALAALGGQNPEVLKTLLVNFPLPSNGLNS